MTTEEGPSVPAALVRAGLSLVPVVGSALAELYSLSRDLDRQRVQQMGEAAQDAAGDDERLIRRLGEDERLLDMLALASEAAQRTSWKAKRVAMGRVLGQAMQDDADIDEDAALLAALAALEAVHFRLLKGMAVKPPQPPPLAEAVISEPYRSQLIAQGTLELGASGTWEPHLRVSGVTAFGHRLLEWVEQDGPIEADGES